MAVRLWLRACIRQLNDVAAASALIPNLPRSGLRQVSMRGRAAVASSSWATPSTWRTSRLRLSEIANWKTCAEAQPPTERFASSVDAWQGGCGIQQLSDAVDVEDFNSAAV